MSTTVCHAHHAAIAFCLVLGACVRAPEVQIVSQATAYEKQAAGEYPQQDEALTAAAVSPGPAPIPREQLPERGEAGGLSIVDDIVARAESDEQQLDRLLLAHCVGEARSGLVEVMQEPCSDENDLSQLSRLVGRINVHRRQIFALIASRRPGMSEDAARTRWRTIHLQRVLCGAWVERETGGYEAKVCATK